MEGTGGGIPGEKKGVVYGRREKRRWEGGEFGGNYVTLREISQQPPFYFAKINRNNYSIK